MCLLSEKIFIFQMESSSIEMNLPYPEMEYPSFEKEFTLFWNRNLKRNGNGIEKKIFFFETENQCTPLL